MSLLAKTMDLLLGRTYGAMEPAPMEKPPEDTPAQLCNLCRQQLERSVQFGLARVIQYEAIHKALAWCKRIGTVEMDEPAIHFQVLIEDCIRKARDAFVEVNYTAAGGHIDMALDKLDKLQEALR